MAKFVSLDEAVALIPDGASIMVGGFMGCGNPHKIIDALSKSGKGNFTLICNDGSMPGGPLGEDYYGVAKLIHNGQVTHLIATHVGLNPEVAARMNDGSMKVDLIPQGSLAEMIRAGGAGLGGVLTPTGVGTIVAEGKQEIVVDGKTYLLETPLRAEVAIVKAWKADTSGNLGYRRAGKNFNPMMAMAADFVIAEVEEIVEVGQIDPDQVCTPGACVDMVVQL